MSQDLQSRGELAQTPFHRLVARLWQQRFTGVLLLQDGEVQHRAFFSNGEPAGSRTGQPVHQLGSVLLRLGMVSEAVLADALARQRATRKLTGQVLLELGAIDQRQLDEAMATQSRLNFLALFAVSDGAYELQEGLVHLTDFQPSPMSALRILYDGLREIIPERQLDSTVARLAFAAMSLSPAGAAMMHELGAAEQMVGHLLAQPRLAGDLARRVPLPARALAALLVAMVELGVLELAPAIKAQ